MVETISLLPLSAALLSALLIVMTAASPKKESLTVRLFLLLNLATFAWSFGYFLQLNWGSYPDPGLARFTSADYALLVLYSFGIAFSPTYWFLFAASNARSRFWMGRPGFLLAHVPAAYTVVVSLTNWAHHLFVSEQGGAPAYGPLAPPHQITTFLLVLGGIYYLTKNAWSKRTLSGRRQAVILGAAAMLPTFGGLMWSTRDVTRLPIPLNLTPVLFPVLNLVLAYQVIRGQLAEIVPVSTLSTIMDNTDAHLAYLDRDFRFASVNSAFVERSGHAESELLGRRFFELFPNDEHRMLFEQVRTSCRAVERRAEAAILPPKSKRDIAYWDWSLSPVEDEGELQGFVLSLVDVTDAVRERELSDEINRVNARIHKGFVSDESLRAVVADAAAALGCESSAVVVSKDRSWHIMQHCERAEATWEPFLEDDEPHIALAMHRHGALLIGDAQNDERLNASLMKAIGVRAAIVVPLVTQLRLIGAVSFNVHSAPTEFAEPQVEFARRFAAAVTVALENARLYESERRIAETLQTSMLNLPDSIAGIDFAHVYRSASESARVGGDFYDLFELEGDRVGILIGDVAGHGLGAAVLTSLIKNTIRAHAFQVSSPAVVVERTNETVRKQIDSSMFATVFFGVLDLATRRLTYCSAGHPPALLVGTLGEVVRLPATSLILGAFADVVFDERQVQLPKGHVLVLYTDGVTEARHDGTMFGETRLSEILVTIATADPHEAVETVFDDVMQFTSSELSDDLALLAVTVADVA